MLKHASVFISLILAGLYALGLTFQQGFLRDLGLEETQFSLSVDRIFFQGFMSATQMGSKGFLYLIASAASIVIIAELGAVASSWIKNTNIKKILLEKFCNKTSGQETHSFTDFPLKAFSYLILIFVLYLLLIVALVFSGRSGVEWSKKFKNNVIEKKYIEKTIKFHGNEDSLIGYSIICNSLQCAYLVDGKSIVLNNRDVEWVKSN